MRKMTFLNYVNVKSLRPRSDTWAFVRRIVGQVTRIRKTAGAQGNSRDARCSWRSIAFQFENLGAEEVFRICWFWRICAVTDWRYMYMCHHMLQYSFRNWLEARFKGALTPVHSSTCSCIPDFILTVETMNLRTKHCKYMYVYICALNPHLPILRDRPRLPL